jgi:hypothetical protein
LVGQARETTMLLDTPGNTPAPNKEIKIGARL